MIPYEEFTIIDSKYHPSTGFKRLLKQESIDILTGLTLDRIETSKTVVKVFPMEDMISVTKLERTQDPYYRSIVTNHTTVFKLMDYLNYYNIFSLYPPEEMVELITI